jgi:ion channel POLLUX/CASTOR
VLKDALLQSYDHIMVLCYSDTLEIQHADAITLLTLWHVRAIADEQGYVFTLTSEMMDARNRDLAESTRADDFILSDRLIGHMMIQIARNRAMNIVFKELLDPAGASIYLRPAGDYIALGEPVSFYTVIEAAQRRGDVAIGYRRQAAVSGGEGAHGVVVNPAKSVPVTFSSGDQIIVVAQD